MWVRYLVWPPVGPPGLPSFGIDQLVKAVVGVMADRFDALVCKVTNLQGLVLDTQDIAYRVVDVIQVLQGFLLWQARVQAYKPPIARRVTEHADHTIARGLIRYLTLGVVVNIAHQHLMLAFLEAQVCLAQLPVHVVIKLLLVALGVGLHHKLTQGVEEHLRGRALF